MDKDEIDGYEVSLQFLQRWRGQHRNVEMPDPMQLAAWVDGNLDEAAASEVELKLATDADLLRALLEGKQAPAMAPTVREVTAARSLVRPQATISQLLEWFRPLFNPTVAITTVALMLVVGSGGFELGQELAGMTMEQKQVAMRFLFTDELSPLSGED